MTKYYSEEKLIEAYWLGRNECKYYELKEWLKNGCKIK